MTRPFHLEKLVELPISAASGVCCVGRELFVVADDEVAMLAVDLVTYEERRVALVRDELPEEHAARKRRKPDFEALTLLPRGLLFAVGSGSEVNRRRGVLVSAPEGATHEHARVVDLGRLFEKLALELPDLNVEGAVVHGAELVLAQRGNGAAGVSALVRLSLETALAELERGFLSADGLVDIVELALPDLDGVRLTPTDLASDGRLLYFSAAAESGDSTYLDGECVGSALGVVEPNGRVLACTRVSEVTKLEGLAFDPRDPDRAYCVSDPDDRSVRAPLFLARGVRQLA